MEKLFVCIGIIGLCVATSAAATIKNIHQSQPSNCEYQCMELSSSVCASHFGLPAGQNWFARFPNARGLDLTASITEFFHFYPLMELDNYCSHVLYNFLCFHYFPKCSEERPFLAAVPCRETCEEAVSACLEHARTRDPTFQFPEHLNCSNFQHGSSTCGGGSASGENSNCGSECAACPNALIHLEFATAPGARKFEVSESDGEVEISLRLANVGSYDLDATLQQEVIVTLRPMAGSAEAGVDFVAPQESTIVFPVGSRKGDVKSITIEIAWDSVEESVETFSVHANITSPTVALFGGELQSSTGSISVDIANSEAPTPPPDPVMPEGECRDSCSWRTSINKATFRRNPYTYAAHVRVVGCRGSVLDVVVLECLDVECGVCPPNGDYKIPYCTNCFDACPVGEEYILSGLHTEESLIVSNYRKGGLRASVFEGWQRRVPPCHS